jgi:2-amino-4-hydroxy-6-hydroxymethyldihydropteridine diphosphokinase
MKTVYLSLGSNIGDREGTLRTAVQKLAEQGIQIAAQSSLYETDPQDFRNQPWFLNLAIACETSMFPRQLLGVTQRIERELGRRRHVNIGVKGPRTIDIDILLFAGRVIDTSTLTIPHPRMLDRRFVLEPLFEIAPGLRHPVTGELLSGSLPLVQSQQVRKFKLD